jgi:hypothetical protein
MGLQGMDEKRSTSFRKKNLEEKDNYQDLGADERIVLRWILNGIGVCGNVDLNHLVQDRDQWRAVVNTVMNVRVS